MKIPFFGRFNIAKKIALNSILVILLATVSGFYSLITLRSSRVIDDQVTECYYPLISVLKDFDQMVRSTSSLSTNWMYLPNPQDKENLILINKEGYPAIKEQVNNFILSWPNQNLDTLKSLLELYDTTIPSQKKLMSDLDTDLAYQDDFIIFDLITVLDSDITMPLSNVHNGILLQIDSMEERVKLLIENKYSSFNSVETVIIVMTILAIIIGSLVSYLSTSSIVKPVTKLNEVIERLGLGDLTHIDIKRSNDEVGDMVESINRHMQGLQETSYFAAEIGKGNLEVKYEILSDKDVLGKALLTMRDNLSNVINETKDVMQQAGTEGNLNARVSNEGKEGAWKELNESINNLLVSIAIPVMTVNEIANAMSKGDLTQRYQLEAKGEILSLAENLNSALTNLDGLLNQISDSANIVDDSAAEMLGASEEMGANTGEIASAIAQMSAGAQTQVAKVDETSALIEGILKSSNDMGQRATAINEGVNNVVMDSSEGEQMLDKVVSNMSEISTYSLKTNDSIKVLTLRSAEISKVLGVITEIASQTNLLALNAAIEAAQAGDAGRGFAVVAEEIRKLAEDSRNSAREIEKLIGDVQTDTKEAVSVIEVMNRSVKIGEETSNEAVEMFKKIADSARNNLSLSQDILEATQAQAKDINEVVSNTESVVVVAEETATGTEEVATSATGLSSGMENYTQKSEKLTQIASELKAGIGKFKLSDTSN